MRFVFLTLVYPVQADESNLYTDLFDEITSLGHHVTVIKPNETACFGEAICVDRKGVTVYSVPTGKLTKTNFLEKGINTILLGFRYLSVLKRIPDFDILTYSTPPITFNRCVKYAKQQKKTTFLLLKDIFPQNCVDLSVFSEHSIPYLLFRHDEKILYNHSDIIGCMSPANVKYLLEHNPEINPDIVKIVPNSIMPKEHDFDGNQPDILSSLRIPKASLKLVYGGNLGKPQGVAFIIECLLKVRYIDDVFIVIVGSGTEYSALDEAIRKYSLDRVLLIPYLPKNEYISLLAKMDLGLIFLDSRFTIPNFPSRILDYMSVSIPVIACTDRKSDIKEEICDKGAGLWCPSDDSERFKGLLLWAIQHRQDLSSFGKKAKQLLNEQYDVRIVAKNMIKMVEELQV